MIWIALVAVVIVAGGSWFVARSMRTRITVFVVAALAAGGYIFLGHPGMSDQPLSSRVAELETQATKSPETMRPDQIMAIAEHRSLENPKDPQPHYIMGIVLRVTGKPTEAVLAFESALRRDPKHLPSIVALADLLFELSGQVDADTTKLYAQALTLNPADARLAYMLGIGEWQAGHLDQAKQRWAELQAKAPKDDPTLRTLADDLFKMTGKVDPWTAELFREAYEREPDQFQLGYIYGVGLWQSGDHDAAEKLWASIEAKTPKSDPRLQMFAALKQMARAQPGEGPGTLAPQGSSASGPAKAPG